MAELHPPEGPINSAAVAAATTTSTAAAATTATIAASADNTTTTTTNNNNRNNKGPSLAPKRQRRPSVRLGEIGDQPATLSYNSHARRPKTWRFHKDPGLAAKASKTRPLTNLVNGRADYHETLETEDNLEFGNWKSKSKVPMTKKVRTNWTFATKVDSGAEGDGREDNNDDFRNFEPEGSESPLKEQSPVQSTDDAALDYWHGHRRTGRRRDQDEGLPESDSRDRKCGTSRDANFGSGSGCERGRNRNLDDGVRSWLIGLGLGRYAPVFEIHEVDDEVLPMLTLEDLKDMGINAVGSRRKMRTAIENLRKGFS